MDKGTKSRKEILRIIADIIDEYPNQVTNALKHSKVFFEYPLTREKIVDSVAYAIVNNRLFQKNISVVIAYYRAGLLKKGIYPTPEEYVEFSNIGGKDTKVDMDKFGKDAAKTISQSTAAWTATGGWIGAIVGAVIGVVDAGFQWGTASKEAQKKEEIAKAEIYAELFDKDKKKRKKGWWIPVAVVGGVLIAAGVVVFFTLKKKN